jgi:hypothetical protein
MFSIISSSHSAAWLRVSLSMVDSSELVSDIRCLCPPKRGLSRELLRKSFDLGSSTGMVRMMVQSKGQELSPTAERYF